MRIAICLLHWFPHGGLQRDALELARLATAAGHQVEFFCARCSGHAATAWQPIVLGTGGRTNHGRARRFAALLPPALAARRPDAVIGFDKLPGLDLYFAADRCYVDRIRRERPWLSRLTPRYRTFAALERAVFAPESRTRVLLLDPDQSIAYRRVYGTPVERFVALPPGISRDRLADLGGPHQRNEARAALGVEPTDLLVLFVATNPWLKGLDRALRALQRLPAGLRQRARLIAVGAGAPPQARRLVRRLGIADRVQLLPPRDDVPQLLQAADLLVHPARADAGGAVLLEALVAGLPVLCTAAAGHSRWIAAASAGVVVPEPFAQAVLDAALATLLGGGLEPFRAGARHWAATRDLGGLHAAVLAEIERVAATRLAGSRGC